MQVTDDNVLSDFDIFFYYGQNELEIETRSDILQNVMQTKRSLFYDRALDSAGINDYENIPVGLSLKINLPYDVVESIGKRNQFVSNGENNNPDRRVAISQNTIKIDSDNSGNVNITVLYIPLADFKQTESLNIPLGTGGK